MTATILDEYILPVLVRYIDDYRWSFSIAKRLINMYYGTEYTDKELQALYRKSRDVPRSGTMARPPPKYRGR